MPFYAEENVQYPQPGLTVFQSLTGDEIFKDNLFLHVPVP
jgi:hypothetical protein